MNAIGACIDLIAETARLATLPTQTCIQIRKRLPHQRGGRHATQTETSSCEE